MDQLPDVVLLEIFANLYFVDLCACSQVCQRWYALAQSLRLRKKLIVTRRLSHRQLQKLVQWHLHEELEVFELRNDDDCTFLHVKKSTLFKLRTKSPKLKRLVLMGCSLPYISSDELPTFVQFLSVRGSELNPYNFFGSRLHLHVPFLTCLDVGGVSNFFTSENLYIFSNLQNLRCLYLEGCFRINNGGIESIVDILPQLHVLDVEGTDVSNEGVSLILSHCVAARELYVGHLDVDDGALLNHSADGLLKLTTLCIKNTRITPQGIQQFVNSHGKKKMSVFTKFDAFAEDCRVGPNEDLYSNLVFCRHYLSHSCPC